MNVKGSAIVINMDKIDEVCNEGAEKLGLRSGEYEDRELRRELLKAVLTH